MLISSEAYSEIKERIINLKLKPGHIFTESEISKELNLGKTPIREALKRLEQEDFVVSIPYKGYQVTETTKHFVEELFEFRMLIECYISKQLADKIKAGNKKIYKKVLNLFKNIDKAEYLFDNNKKGAVKINTNFHFNLIRLVNNETITRSMSRLSGHLLRAQNISSLAPKRTKKSFLEHRKILTKIAEGKGSMAQKYTQRHILNVKNDIFSQLGISAKGWEYRRSS